MTKLTKITLSTMCLAGAFGVSNVIAADQVDAAANLSGIAAISVQSKANLADAAFSGVIEEIAEAGKRSDAVDAAMAQAQEAYSAIERAVANGDDDAAQSAADDLAAALGKAVDALNGVIPEEVVNAVKQWKDSQKNTGGGPGKPYDPPNMYDVVWNSDSMSDFYQNHFGNLWNSGVNPNDREATPE